MLFVVNFDALAQAIESKQVVFLCWMQDSNPEGLWNRISTRLNARWQTDWDIEDQAKNLNSTTRPYDQRAFSPLDPTGTWLWRYTCCLLLIAMLWHRGRKETSCLSLLNAGFEPRGRLEPNLQQTECWLKKYIEMSMDRDQISLSTW